MTRPILAASIRLGCRKKTLRDCLQATIRYPGEAIDEIGTVRFMNDVWTSFVPDQLQRFEIATDSMLDAIWASKPKYHCVSNHKNLILFPSN